MKHAKCLNVSILCLFVMTFIVTISVDKSFGFYTEDIADVANTYTTCPGNGQCATFVANVLLSTTGISHMANLDHTYWSTCPGGWTNQGCYELGLQKSYGATQIGDWSKVGKGDIMTVNLPHIAIVTLVEHDHQGNITKLVITDCNHGGDLQYYRNVSGQWYLNNSSLRFWRIGKRKGEQQGCTDPKAINYDVNAVVDNGSCQYTFPTLAVFDNKLFQAIQGIDRAISTRIYNPDVNTWTHWVSKGRTSRNVTMIVYRDRLFQAVRSASTSGYIWTRFYTPEDGWSEWDYIDGKTSGDISMAVYQDRLYQAVRSNSDSGKVWTRSYTPEDGWSSWEDTGGQAGGNISMIVYDNRLYQAVGSNSDSGYIWTRYYTPEGGWSAWDYTGGKTSGDVSMVVYRDRLYQAVRSKSTSGYVWTRYYTAQNGWSDWEYTGGQTGGNVSMVVYHDRLYQAVRSNSDSGYIWTRYYTPEAGWHDWNYTGGKTSGDVNMVVFYNRLYQTVRGYGGSDKIWVRYTTDGETWTEWVDDKITTGQATLETISPTGGTLTLINDVVTVTFPPNSISEELVVSGVELVDSSEPPLQSGFSLLGHIYELNATNAQGEPISHFEQDIHVTFQYDPNELGGVDETLLNIWYYDEMLNQWIALPSTVNTTAHTVTALTDHFTKFAVLVNEFIPVPTVIPDDPTPDPSSAVPEPGTMMLVGVGLIGMFMILRKRR